MSLIGVANFVIVYIVSHELIKGVFFDNSYVQNKIYLKKRISLWTSNENPYTDLYRIVTTIFSL